MGFTSNSQYSTAFKNLLGKSQTDQNGKEVGNESIPLSLNVHANTIFVENINPIPATAITDGVAVAVTADLVLDPTSNGHAYIAKWASTPPAGTDPKTALPFAYGSGSLTGIAAGDRIVNAIDTRFGDLYEAKPYDVSSNIIPVLDPRDWIYQYNSGVFFQQDVLTPNPSTIQIYVYIGQLLSDAIGTQVSTNIPVDATLVIPTPSGSPLANEYTGSTVGPNIVTYDDTVIYLVTFDTDNTTNVRLNIDGIGALDVLKGDDTGLIPLVAGDIQANVIYYLVYDGTQFQLFTLSPAPTPGTYTNLNPSTVAVGGIPAGTIFNNMTYTNLFNTMFYPNLVSSFASFLISGQATSLEVGQSIAAGSKTFNWSVNNPTFTLPNTIKIQDINTGAVLLNLSANDGTEVINFASAITKVVSTTHRWRISAVRTNGTTFTRDFTVGWYWRRFYGTSLLTSLAEADAEALVSQGITSVNTGTYNFAAGGYKYFVLPTALPAVNFFRDSATNLAVAMAGVAEGYTSTTGNGLYYKLLNITNAYGVTHSYRVYRTRNVLGGSIQIIVT